jgi:hypothetical protein
MKNLNKMLARGGSVLGTSIAGVQAQTSFGELTGYSDDDDFDGDSHRLNTKNSF